MAEQRPFANRRFATPSGRCRVGGEQPETKEGRSIASVHSASYFDQNVCGGNPGNCGKSSEMEYHAAFDAVWI